jgi:putative ABC transport system substrate-binding protein
MFEKIRGLATARGIEVFSRQIHGVEDLAPAFDDAARVEAQAVVFMTDNELFGHRKEVAQLSLGHHLPSIHSFEPEAQDGGLMSYGPSLGESYQRVAALTDSILKGARPADLAVEQPTKFELAINLKTAKALSIRFPPSIMVQANEVIE